MNLWTKLEADWLGCRRCSLHQRRIQEEGMRNLVLGAGNLRADIMLVGEGPGHKEERLGAPFCGDAGAILNVFLLDHKVFGPAREPRNEEEEQKAIQHIREKKVFITNAVCCRPCDVIVEHGRKRTVDKAPPKEALDACRPRLYEQIYMVDPLLIVAMGAVALKTLAGAKAKLKDWLGEITTIEIPGKMTTDRTVGKGKKARVIQVPVPIRYPCLATYHPSYILRNRDFESDAPDSLANQVLGHFRKARRLLDEHQTLEGGRA